MSSAISDLLAKLNPEQRSAVEKIDGPVLVLAGPGTGKTHVLTTRIAHILDQTDAQPHNILALTFSDAGAKTMQSRLIELIGLPAYDVTISTFHAFSSDLIMKHQSEYAKLTGFTQITDLEQSEILESILIYLKVTKILTQGDVQKSISSISQLISSLKQEHQTPLLLKKLLKDEREALPDKPEKDTKKAIGGLNKARKQLDKLEEFIEVFAAYQTTLQDKKRYDYPDMVLFALDLLDQNPDILLELQEQYQYVLVDEFQDTNNSQYELLDALTSYWADQANLFVVGDPDQTIYRFQGASTENIQRFQARFPETHVVQLQENYRSTQPILDAAESMIKLNSDHTRENPLSANSNAKAQPLEVTTHSSTLYEQIWIAQQVKKLIENGESPNEIAILTKQRREVETLADIFSRMEIPFLLDKGVDAITHSSMLQLRRFLSAVSSMTMEKPEDDLLFTVMSYPWLNLDFTDVLTLFRYCKEARTSFASYLLGDSWKKLNLKHPEKIEAFKINLAEWVKHAEFDRVSAWLDIVVQDSGFLGYLLEDFSGVRLKAYHAIHKTLTTWEQQQPGFTVDQFFQSLDRMRAQRIPLPVETALNPEKAITISTVHGAKGKEWNVVFLSNLVSIAWEKKRVSEIIPPVTTMLEYQAVNENQKIEELRRLFYVGITRARAQCYLSYGRKGDDLTAKDRLPSLFIESISEKHRVTMPIEHDQSDLLTILGQLATKSTQQQFENEEWLRQLASRINLSASSVNAYLSCKYKFLLRHIFRIPTAINERLEYGNAVHAALERFFKIWMENSEEENSDQPPKKQILLDLFEQQMRVKALTEDRIHFHTTKGVEELSEYYDAFFSTWSSPLDIERQVGRAGGVQLDGIPLNGKIDRLEFIDPEEKTVRIIDYKTGKPKTDGEIEGTTKHSEGETKRQLVFYALLLSLDTSFKHTISEAMVSFIRKADDLQKHREYTWKVNEGELEELKDTIKTVYSSIQNLDFERTTDQRVCKNCDFKNHCWPEGLPQYEVQPQQEALDFQEPTK